MQFQRAHVGISLSEAEASVAAPFTAKRTAADVRCVPTLISEGRAALVTSFSLFKFICAYAQAELVNAVFLYWFDIGYANYQVCFMPLNISCLQMFTEINGNFLITRINRIHFPPLLVDQIVHRN